jgi:hypothetical protein
MPRTAAALLVLLACAAPLQADEPKKVSVQFLGGAKKVPLEGVKVSLFRSTGNYSQDKKKATTTGTTDKAGAAAFALAPGRYYVDIASEKEFPYLHLPVGYDGHPHHFSRSIAVGADGAQAFSFNLADACKLTLRAVDADTGRGLAGVRFVTENALGEVWGIDIEGDNLGAKPVGKDGRRTDKDGFVTCLLGPRPGYTYFGWSPRGYEPVGRWEVELPTPNGTAKKEHTFQFRIKQGPATSGP